MVVAQDFDETWSHSLLSIRSVRSSANLLVPSKPTEIQPFSPCVDLLEQSEVIDPKCAPFHQISQRRTPPSNEVHPRIRSRKEPAVSSFSTLNGVAYPKDFPRRPVAGLHKPPLQLFGHCAIPSRSTRMPRR